MGMGQTHTPQSHLHLVNLQISKWEAGSTTLTWGLLGEAPMQREVVHVAPELSILHSMNLNADVWPCSWGPYRIVSTLASSRLSNKQHCSPRQKVSPSPTVVHASFLVSLSPSKKTLCKVLGRHPKGQTRSHRALETTFLTRNVLVQALVSP